MNGAALHQIDRLSSCEIRRDLASLASFVKLFQSIAPLYRKLHLRTWPKNNGRSLIITRSTHTFLGFLRFDSAHLHTRVQRASERSMPLFSRHPLVSYKKFWLCVKVIQMYATFIPSEFTQKFRFDLDKTLGWREILDNKAPFLRKQHRSRERHLSTWSSKLYFEWLTP